MDDNAIPAKAALTGKRMLPGGPSYSLPDTHGTGYEYPIGRTFLLKITDAVTLKAKMKALPQDLSGDMEGLMGAVTRWSNSNMQNNGPADGWYGDIHPFDIDCSHLENIPGYATFICIYLADTRYHFNPDRKLAITAEQSALQHLCNPRLWAVGDPTPKYLTFKAEPYIFSWAFNLSFVKDSDGTPLEIDPKVKNNGTTNY